MASDEAQVAIAPRMGADANGLLALAASALLLLARWRHVLALVDGAVVEHGADGVVLHIAEGVFDDHVATKVVRFLCPRLHGVIFILALAPSHVRPDVAELQATVEARLLVALGRHRCPPRRLVLGDLLLD